MNSDKIITGSLDRTARIWDSESGRLLHTLIGHDKEIICLGSAANGNIGATGSMDCTCVVWDLRNGQPIAQLVVYY